MLLNDVDESTLVTSRETNIAGDETVGGDAIDRASARLVRLARRAVLEQVRGGDVDRVRVRALPR